MPKIDATQIRKPKATKKQHRSELNAVEKIEFLFQKHLPEIYRNVITGDWELKGVPLTEEDLNTWILIFQSELTGITEPLFFRYLKSNNITQINPIHEYFKNTKVSDNISGTIHRLASCINTDTILISDEKNDVDYTEHFLTKWMVGAVAQVYGRGVNPLMLVLAGSKQNTGKTTFFRNLLPVALKPYLAEPKGLSDMKDADLGMILCENFICFDDEMSGRSWKDWQRMKSMLSMDYYTMRRPYEKRQRKFPRIASMCATNNQLDILGDPTGNRRLIPINVLSINHEVYNNINKDDLWMEAYQLMMDGYDHNLKQHDIEWLNNSTANFEIIDDVVEMIIEYFEPPSKDCVGRYTATQITQILLRYNSIRNLHANKVGEKLRKLGYEQRRDNPEGSKTWIIALKPQYNFKLDSK
jgi:predicted P-loop ATPase